MIKKILGSSFILWLAFMSYGLIVSQHDLSPIETKEQVNRQETLKYYDYRGITHAISNRTRGSRTIEEIFKIAQSSGLDFIFVTDSNQYEAPEVSDLYSNGTRLFVAGKYSYVDSHILVYGGEKIHKFKSIGQSQVLLNDLLTQKYRTPNNMSLVLAHPLREKYEWNGEYPVGLDGIEIVNLKQLWRNKAADEKFHFLFSLLLYPFNDTLSFLNMISAPSKELKLWDKLNQQKNTIGFFGNNTTAKAIIFPTEDGFVRFPAYATSFGIGSNHLLLRSELTGLIQRDKEKILDALHRGQFYMAFDVIGNPKGFYAELTNQKEDFLPGASVPLDKNLSLKVNLPYLPKYPVEIRLFKDGALYSTSDQKEAEFKINSAGVYRVEVSLKPTLPFLQKSKWMPWIYTNPFFVTN